MSWVELGGWAVALVIVAVLLASEWRFWRRHRRVVGRGTVRIRADQLPRLDLQNQRERVVHYRAMAKKSPAFRMAYLHLAQCHEDIVHLYEAIEEAVRG